MKASFTSEYNFQHNPRQLALKTIIEQYPHHPHDQIDPDEQVRAFADRSWHNWIELVIRNLRG